MRTTAFAPTLLALLAACDGGAPPPPTPALATYNAGLARNFVPYADERAAPQAEAIAAIQADILCLQEVWEAPEIAGVEDAAGGAFPHVYREDTTGDPAGAEGGEPACTLDEVQPLRKCVEASCLDDPNLAGCATTECDAEIDPLPAGCFSCLAANITLSIEEIFLACTTGGASLTFEGANGLMLLSRHPLAATGHLVLDSYLTRRAVLHAEVDVDGAPVHAFCTHLTATLGIPYAGAFESWDDERAQQAAAVLAYVEEEAGGEPAVVLGDLNSGPGGDPAALATFLGADFAAPYLDVADPPCTWCADNTLHAPGGDDDAVIDHVLVRGLPELVETAAARRILDQPVAIDVGGEALDLHLSDHFGALVAPE